MMMAMSFLDYTLLNKTANSFNPVNFPNSGLFLQQQQPPAHENRSKIWIILITLWIINGSSFLAIKLTIDTIPPLLSAGIRFTIAGLVLFSIYYIRGGYKRERITKQ